LKRDTTWFENWFDSPYYHLLYQNRDLNEASLFIDNLCHFLKIPENAEILDLACGKGRHSFSLSKKGYRVTGVDLSEQSINYAKKLESKNLNFFIHDMRMPLKSLSFDYVMNIFSSFGYFETEQEHLDTLININKSLKNEGILIIDFLNIKKVLKNIVPIEEKTIDNILFKIQRKTVDSFLLKKIEIQHQTKILNFEEKVMMLDLAKFELWIEKSNFKLIHVLVNYNLEKYDESASDRLILIAQKK
jgi:SAM-dependent methyltransferase